MPIEMPLREDRTRIVAMLEEPYTERQTHSDEADLDRPDAPRSSRMPTQEAGRPTHNPAPVRLATMRPFRVILIEQDASRTTTLVVPFERTPDVGSVVELPQGGRICVQHVLSADRDGLAGIVLAAPA